MKDARLLVWITQLGLTVASPLTLFTLAGIYLRNRFALGKWAILAGIALGLISAVQGFRSTLKALDAAERRRDGKEPPSFNEHN